MKQKTLSYNESMAEVEAILSQIEDNKLDVDELTEKVKRACSLLKTCKAKLFETQQDVEEILKDLDK